MWMSTGFLRGFPTQPTVLSHLFEILPAAETRATFDNFGSRSPDMERRHVLPPFGTRVPKSLSAGATLAFAALLVNVALVEFFLKRARGGQ
jgi:hypothetical protein